MKIRTLIAALATAGMAATVGSAYAGSITFSFNPNGTGTGAGVVTGAAVLDEAPGNALAVGGTAANGAALPVGTIITDYYQANLGTVQAPSTQALYTNGAGGTFFTFVATFTEIVTASTGSNGVLNNSFSILSGTFKMCAQSAIGNNLAGTGFGCAGNGILSGSINGGTASQTGFPAPLVPLDQAGNNDYSGVTTVQSGGFANLSAVINFVNAGYFPDLPVNTALVLSTTNSSLITPFGQIDPSALFSSDTVNANVAGVSSVGQVNGISGPNFIFQADANSSFLTSTVPEPGTLALAGLALAGLATVRRRKVK